MRYYPRCLKELRKLARNAARIVGMTAGMWTEQIPNTSLQHYHHTCLLSLLTYGITICCKYQTILRNLMEPTRLSETSLICIWTFANCFRLQVKTKALCFWRAVLYVLYAVMMVKFKLADILMHMEYCCGSVINKESIIKNVSCDKCLELEHQLKEALQELGLAHLIIELLKKENTMYTTLEHEPTSSSHVSTKQEVHDKWEPVTQRQLNGQKRKKLIGKGKKIQYFHHLYHRIITHLYLITSSLAKVTMEWACQ